MTVFRMQVLKAIGGFKKRVESMTMSTSAALIVASASSATIVLGQSLQDNRTNVRDTVVITDAWARPALKGGTGGAYMTITNAGKRAVQITGATFAGATTTELHSSTVHDGMAHMDMLPKVLITPGASVSFKPGGIHLMFVGLRDAFVKGETKQIRLRLQSGTSVIVNVAVRSQ